MTLEYLSILTCIYLSSAKNVCEKDGSIYDPGDSIKENCNECTCVQLSKFSSQHGFRCSTKKCLVQPRIINQINNGRYSWFASNYSDFWGLTLTDGVKYKLGTFPPAATVAMMTPIFIDLQRQEPLPLTFDSRIKWPGFIHSPPDQRNCGASWAFSTAGVVSDRVAIESEGTFTGYLSAQHLLSCGRKGQGDGCNGGYLDRALYFIRHTGILTNDSYYQASKETKCYRRSSSTDINPDDPPLLYVRMTPAYRIANTEGELMTEIRNNGPVLALMKVKEDFFMYKSGIYRHSASSRPVDGVGYHSVRIIGWGQEAQEDGEILKYWVCANSWGQQWGENGYFRVERGQFEHHVLAAHLSKIELEFKGSPTASALARLSNEAAGMIAYLLEGADGVKGGGSKSGLYNVLDREEMPQQQILRLIQKKGYIRKETIIVRRKKVRKS